MLRTKSEYGKTVPAFAFLAAVAACSQPPRQPQSVARMSIAPLGAPDLDDPNTKPAKQESHPQFAKQHLSTTPGTIEDPSGHALDSFYASLDAGGRTAVVQFGDSHTASDAYTGRLRHVLQKKYGDAGRGFVLPGLPFAGYMAEDVLYGSVGPWRAENGLYRTSHGPFGMAGFRVHTESANASAWVGTCATCESGKSASRLEVMVRKTENGGQLAVQIDDGAWHMIDTRSEGGYSTAVPDGAHRITVRPVGDGTVDVIGMVMERDRPGVVVDSLGVVSARAAHLCSWDWKDLGPQLAARDPRLVILAYGTNEVDLGTSPAELEKEITDLVERVKQAAPETAVLVLGPPDMNRWTAGSWRTPSNLPAIVDAERRGAFAAGAAFFDQYTAMGGANVMDRLFAQGLASRDRVHMSGRGYQLAADLLLDQLIGKSAGTRSR
jgi:lysophospholipase L1-like esterase